MRRHERVEAKCLRRLNPIETITRDNVAKRAIHTSERIGDRQCWNRAIISIESSEKPFENIGREKWSCRIVNKHGITTARRSNGVDAVTH